MYSSFLSDPHFLPCWLRFESPWKLSFCFLIGVILSAVWTGFSMEFVIRRRALFCVWTRRLLIRPDEAWGHSVASVHCAGHATLRDRLADESAQARSHAAPRKPSLWETEAVRDIVQTRYRGCFHWWQLFCVRFWPEIDRFSESYFEDQRFSESGHLVSASGGPLRYRRFPKVDRGEICGRRRCTVVKSCEAHAPAAWVLAAVGGARFWWRAAARSVDLIFFFLGVLGGQSFKGLLLVYSCDFLFSQKGGQLIAGAAAVAAAAVVTKNLLAADEPKAQLSDAGYVGGPS